MPLSEITSFAEIAAALATVATLVYLSVQIRTNTTVQKAEARRAVQAITNDYSALIAQDKMLHEYSPSVLGKLKG